MSQEKHWVWGFTPGEKRALLLICAALLLGSAYRIWQRHSARAPLQLTREDSLALAAIKKAANVDSPIESSPVRIAKTPNQHVAAKGASASPILDINRATQRDLEALPGIGPALARRILDARFAQGGFTQVEDLLKVPGIGPQRLQKIRPLITCTASSASALSLPDSTLEDH